MTAPAHDTACACDLCAARPVELQGAPTATAPRRIVCTNCGGSGRFHFDSRIIVYCNVCRGNGSVVFVPAPVSQ